jgi:hypothetical protein
MLDAGDRERLHGPSNDWTGEGGWGDRFLFDHFGRRLTTAVMNLDGGHRTFGFHRIGDSGEAIGETILVYPGLVWGDNAFRGNSTRFYNHHSRSAGSSAPIVFNRAIRDGSVILYQERGKPRHHDSVREFTVLDLKWGKEVFHEDFCSMFRPETIGMRLIFVKQKAALFRYSRKESPHPFPT